MLGLLKGLGYFFSDDFTSGPLDPKIPDQNPNRGKLSGLGELKPMLVELLFGFWSCMSAGETRACLAVCR